MKHLLNLVFYFLPVSLLAQVTYEPIFIEQCSGKIVNPSTWFLTDSDGSFGDIFIGDRSDSTVNLPTFGTYWMFLDFRDGPIEINVPNEKYVKDTIRMPRLELVHYISNPPRSEYLDCGELAQGFIIDYYDEGGIRMKGTFKNGDPIDSLFTYDQHGNLSELFVPNKTGWKHVEYYENGQEKSRYDVANREEKEYYFSGQLKREESWDSEYQRNIKEFTESGQLVLTQTKNEQKKFSENGKLTSVITRKEVLKIT